MQVEKNIIIDDLMERVNASPFMLVTDFTGLTVGQFEELRVRLEGFRPPPNFVKGPAVSFSQVWTQFMGGSP